MISKDVTDKINQLLNNGYSFGKHKTKKQRDEIEQDLLDYYDKNGFGAFLEEEMIYIVDTNISIYIYIYYLISSKEYII